MKILLKKRVAFIGAGNMAEAIIAGIIKSNIIPSSNIYISDLQTERLNLLKKKFNINSLKSNYEAFEKGDFIFLSVKPQFMKEAIETIVREENYKKIDKKKSILSIAAGMKLSKIKEFFLKEKELSFVRIMPNTPALVSAGISGFYAEKNTLLENIEAVETILKTFGKVILFEKEDSLDAVTAISGSGPAYVFYFFESLLKAAKNLGFENREAEVLVFETMQGSLRLLEETKLDAKTLRENVTSKNGTTEAALKVLKERDFQKIVLEAVNKAFIRAREISNK